MLSMKNIIFKTLKLTNFLSVGEEPVVVDFKQGLSLITGRNIDKPERRNAIGKSTIADAFYFCIFGETLRELKKDLIGNNITNGKTVVELHFDVVTSYNIDSYKLVRTLSPSKVYLQKNGEDITRDSISNTTKFVCEILSASPAAFQNCIIMTINNAVPFMAKSKVEKRKFIEDIFGLEVFSKMLSVARSDYNETKKQLDISNVKLEEISNTLSNYQRQQENTLAQKQQTINNLTERLNKTTSDIKKTEEDLSKIEIVEIDTLTSKEVALKQKQQDYEKESKSILVKCTEIQVDIKNLKDTRSKIGTSANTCPTCLKSIDQHDHTHIEDEKTRILQEINDKEAEIVTLKVNQTKTQDIIKKIQDGITKISQNIRKNDESKRNQKYLEDRKVELLDWVSKIQNDIQETQSKDQSFDDIIKETELKKQDLQETTDEIRVKLGNLDVIRFIVSEEGVKSYIVTKLLDLLNGRLQHYLLKLDSNTKCVFNEYFEEEIINEKGKVCSYFNFSGAERKAIDLACLFAFSDIRRMQGGVSYNVSIYDELFDSSFDEKGIELVTSILRDRIEDYQESSIVISHRKESMSAVTGEVIFLEKRNGITTRVDYSDF